MIFELVALYIRGGIFLKGNWVGSLYGGERIELYKGQLLRETQNPTHKIIGLYGQAFTNMFFAMVYNIQTSEVDIIEIGEPLQKGK